MINWIAPPLIYLRWETFHWQSHFQKLCEEMLFCFYSKFHKRISFTLWELRLFKEDSILSKSQQLCCSPPTHAVTAVWGEASWEKMFGKMFASFRPEKWDIATSWPEPRVRASRQHNWWQAKVRRTIHQQQQSVSVISETINCWCIYAGSAHQQGRCISKISRIGA